MACYQLGLSSEIVQRLALNQSQQHPSIIVTIRAAKELQPNTNLPSVLCVPSQRQQTDVFSSKGVMEDVPLHLIIIPVPRQRLQTNDRGGNGGELLSHCTLLTD